MKKVSAIPRNGEISARQIAFCAAFILPLGKFLEVPALLSKDARGDILLPAIVHFLVQTLVLLGVLYACSRSKKSLLERLQARLGKGMIALYILYGAYFLFAAFLPLLDLEKFVYAAFFDTAPTTFSFGVFFVLLAFVCTKGIKSVGRCADLCLFLFLLPFLALLGMAFFETDLSRLLPFFGTEFTGVARAFVRSAPQFSDAALLLPLLLNLRYQEGDGVKISLGYMGGGVITLFFFAVFFGIFASLAPREHYAFLKIAQYFPALNVIGRIDLIFIYLLSVVLVFYTCLPLIYTVECVARTVGTERKALYAGILSLALFILMLFANQHYNALYAFISGKLVPLFWVFTLLPLFCLLLPADRQKEKKEGVYAGSSR